MSELVKVPGKRLGRKPASHRVSLNFADYLTGVVPEVPASVNHLGGVAQWNLGGNNQFGTCGPTACSNFTTMAFWFLDQVPITVTDDDIYTLYRYAGNPDFNPATGADDNGVNMNVLMEAWVEHGLWVTHAKGGRQLVKPVATASIPVGAVDTMRAATSLLGGVLFGFNMQVAQQSQQIWTPVAGSGEWGGHCVFGGSYTSVASDDEHVISWAAQYGTSDSFVQQQDQEMFVAILPQFLQKPDFQAGVNIQQLASDWTDLTGKSFPAPA